VSKMVSITYVGPHRAVELERPDGTIAEVEHGGALETDAEHAAALLEQASNWQLPRTSAAKSAKAEKEEAV
jgi:hypothetical protein